MKAERSLADQHRQAVLDVLHDGGRLTRNQISQRVGVTRSTVSEVLSGLRDEGAVVIADSVRMPGRGRPAEVLSLDPSAARYMGIDFAHNRVLVLVTNASGHVIATDCRAYLPDQGWGARCAIAITLAEDFARSDLLHYRFLQGIAIGLPGPNSALWDSSVVAAPLEPYQQVGARVCELFGKRFGVGVWVDHHIRFAALGEATHPNASAEGNLLYLRLSLGVGGAIVTGGLPVRGEHQLGGEAGHVIVDRSDRARDCRCGRRGCLETLASVGGVLQSCRELGLGVYTIDAAAEAVRDNHTAALEVVNDVARVVGQVLGTAAVILDPAEIVLTGEVARLSVDFTARVAKALAGEVLPSVTIPVRLAHLGDEAGALGAVASLTTAFHPAQRTKEFAMSSLSPELHGR
ncbi:ROK family transcriptional regulator [Tessaracoccus antarcticus]|uniref:ROK family transcriptional regulator n=1 Tax=Tessaracoccus antarcticus TaxID=2479848 RepID=A0A3M0GCI3_9ACTN|nr:ROK family transcriptional regulator [Tessaracoccus antarcticus]RMB62207.1 ROK family transcriptional regulator [Tessaracoccus antarcticus]